jgi:hypothetical protein
LDWMELISSVINNNGWYYIEWSNSIWDCCDMRRERGV